MRPIARPQHWVTDGDSPQCFPVKPWSEEGMAVAGYFLEGMPEHTEIEAIERWEHGPLFSDYCGYRDDVLRDLARTPQNPVRANSAREAIEAWLFCGTGYVDDVLTDGFPATDVNIHESRFGLGVYFARDPRLSHFLLDKLGVQHQGKFQLILARVAVGNCFRQTAVRTPKEVVKDEHCRPPPDHHSCTLTRAPGCEVVVFPGLGATPAYPAYVVTYRSQLQLQADPYEELALLRIGIQKSKVLNANPFKQYKSKCRPNWSVGVCQQPHTSQPQTLNSLQSLADWRARSDVMGGNSEMLPAGSPMSAIRARNLDEGNWTNQDKQPQPLHNATSCPMLSMGAPTAAIAKQERTLRPSTAPGKSKGKPKRRWPQAQKNSAVPPQARPSTEPSFRHDSKSSCSFRSQSTGTARSMRRECSDEAFSESLGSHSGAVGIEVANLPDLSSTGLAPEAYVSDILNPKLRLLRDFDGSKGEAIRCAWSRDSETVILELQSKWLVASTARILDGLPLFGSKLQVRIVPLAEADASEAPASETNLVDADDGEMMPD